MRLLQRAVWCAVALAGWLSATCGWAIVVSDPDDDRVVVPGQLVHGVDLDGVAKLGLNLDGGDSFDDIALTCTGALITSRHVLTAAHCFDVDQDGEVDGIFGIAPYVAAFELSTGHVSIPLDLDKVYFPPGWPENQGDEESGLEGVPLDDLAIVELQHDAPPEIPRYPLHAGAVEVPQRVVIVGYGDTGYGATGVDIDASEPFRKRAGLNSHDIVDSQLLLYDFDSGLDEHNTVAIFGAEFGVDSDLGFGLDEVMAADGDSGGPVFLDGTIVGVSFVVLVDPDVGSSWGDLGINLSVAHFQDFILTTTDGAAVFIPEPTFHVLPLALAAVWAALLMRNRGRDPGIC